MLMLPNFDATNFYGFLSHPQMVFQAFSKLFACAARVCQEQGTMWLCMDHDFFEHPKLQMATRCWSIPAFFVS